MKVPEAGFLGWEKIANSQTSQAGSGDDRLGPCRYARTYHPQPTR